MKKNLFLSLALVSVFSLISADEPSTMWQNFKEKISSVFSNTAEEKEDVHYESFQDKALALLAEWKETIKENAETAKETVKDAQKEVVARMKAALERNKEWQEQAYNNLVALKEQAQETLSEKQKETKEFLESVFSAEEDGQD